MPPSLSIDCWRVNEPAATDPIERSTWASMRIRIGGRSVTHYLDSQTGEAAESIFVPTFPLARWIVDKWWGLFYEPCIADAPPDENGRWEESQRQWILRHCLRSSDSSLFLPYLNIFSNGPGISLVWYADNSELTLRLPGYYLYSGTEQIDKAEAIDTFGQFIGRVIGWCEKLSDPRVEQLREDWEAITSADAEEEAFCRAAGRLGLDPYDLTTWIPGIAEFITKDLGSRIDDAVVEDLLEAVVKPELAGAAWRWISNAESEFSLGAGAPTTRVPGKRFIRAKDHGYFLAREMRRLAGIDRDQPILDFALLTRGIDTPAPGFQAHNHLSSRSVQAAVGWSGGSVPLIVGPRPQNPVAARFLTARGWYQALFGCRRGVRLLTRAHTWDQQASRAFAAELLALQEALAAEGGFGAGNENRVTIRERLADRYQVSSEVVRLQLENYGIGAESFDES